MRTIMHPVYGLINDVPIREYAAVLVQSIVRDAEFFNKTIRFCKSAGVDVSVEVINGNRLRVIASVRSSDPDAPSAPVAEVADAADLKSAPTSGAGSIPAGSTLFLEAPRPPAGHDPQDVVVPT